MISSIKDIIESKIIVKHQDNKVEFHELEDGALLKKVTFSVSSFLREGGGLLKNAVIIEGDSSIEPNLKRFTFYLNEECPDITRQCDYIVFHESLDAIRVILIDLKSSDTSKDLTARIHKQLQFSKVFCQYIIGIAEAYAQLKEVVINKPITYHKLALVKAENVAMSLPLGKPPQEVSKLPSSESNDIKSLFLNTDRNGAANLEWRQFMENV